MTLRLSILTAVVSVAICQSAEAQEDKAMAGKQIELAFTTQDSAEVPYLLYLPKNFKRGNGDTYPLIFFLHGRGESNGPLSLVAKWGPPKFAKRGDSLPFIVVSPQCPRDDKWDSDTQQQRLGELLDDVVEKYSVDQDRIYLTGLSMGGYGSWRMAAEHPDRFAAVVPVCGGGDPKNGDRLTQIPIWAFHGDQDRAVPIDESAKMVAAIKTAGGKKIRFTTLEHMGHNCWSAAYATPGLYRWLQSQGDQRAGQKNKATK